MENTCQAVATPNILAAKRPILSLTHAVPRPQPMAASSEKSRTIRTEHSVIRHPHNGSTTYGFVPPLLAITGSARSLPVRLTYGRQAGDEYGYGALHCWKGHEEDIRELGGDCPEDSALLVASVIKDGTSLFFEKNEGGSSKIVAYRPCAGTVVLGLTGKGNFQYWKVITAHAEKGRSGRQLGQITV